MDKPTFAAFSTAFPGSTAAFGRPDFGIVVRFSSPLWSIVLLVSWSSGVSTTAEAASLDETHVKGWTLDGEAECPFTPSSVFLSPSGKASNIA